MGFKGDSCSNSHFYYSHPGYFQKPLLTWFCYIKYAMESYPPYNVGGAKKTYNENMFLLYKVTTKMY